MSAKQRHQANTTANKKAQIPAMITRNPLPSEAETKMEENFTTPAINIPLEDRCLAAAQFLADLLFQFNAKPNLVFTDENFDPLWNPEGEYFGELRIGKKIGRMLVSALFSIEDVNYDDLEEFSDTIQDSELKENTIVFFKVLSECLHLPKSQTKDFCSDDSPQNQRAR